MADADATELQGDGKALGGKHPEEERRVRGRKEAEKAANWERWRLAGIFSKLVSSERRYTAALIAHLAEISRRKGHLELGFKSLFE